MPVTSKCQNSSIKEYIFVADITRTFDEAQSFCAGLNATLATIPDEDSFIELESFLLSAANRNSPWISLRRDEDDVFLNSTDFSNPNIFFENTQGDFGNVVNGEFPWEQGKPDNNIGQNQSCV